MAVATRPAIFLDRDGVLNHAVVRKGLPFPPNDVASLRIYEEAPAALAKAKVAGFKLIVVTNQPDVARGTQRREVVDEINGELLKRLPIDEFLMCFHDSSCDCNCRKPKPGLIFEGARRHAVDLDKSFLIGDRWRDIDAGVAAGVTTVMIDRGYAERGPTNAPDAQVTSLDQAISFILWRSLDSNAAAV